MFETLAPHDRASYSRHTIAQPLLVSLQLGTKVLRSDSSDFTDLEVVDNMSLTAASAITEDRGFYVRCPSIVA